MHPVEVIEDPAAAVAALPPARSRLLAELAQPASAATLASRLGIARQKVNYHLRALESHGLVRIAEERRWGGLTERVLVATAASYVVSPAALGAVAVDPRRRAGETGKRLPTFSLDTEIRFRSAAERAAFSDDLTRAVTALAARYHDESTPGGRAHRLVVIAHPLPHQPVKKEPS